MSPKMLVASNHKGLCSSWKQHCSLVTQAGGGHHLEYSWLQYWRDKVTVEEFVPRMKCKVQKWPVMSIYHTLVTASHIVLLSTRKGTKKSANSR
jgi:hypothetical protein